VTTMGEPAGRLGRLAQPASVVRRMFGNLAAWSAALARKRRAGGAPHAWWPPLSSLAIGTGATIAAVAAAMLALDSWAIGHHRSLPTWLVLAAGDLTDFGKSGWFLIPAALLLIAIAAAAAPALGRTTYLVLTSLAARIGFVFAAVALPSVAASIVKRLIGRARPLRIEGQDLYFAPLSWRVDFASLPSGHSTTAFAAAVALGALFPRARVALWIYAGVIALTRVILTVHYPSDVIAGAILGGCGALIVRRWFAARRLGFTLRPDGSVRVLPGPSLQRIKKVARRIAGQ
jgi:membrane-associated phospholipid phosphatase